MGYVRMASSVADLSQREVDAHRRGGADPFQEAVRSAESARNLGSIQQANQRIQRGAAAHHRSSDDLGPFMKIGGTIVSRWKSASPGWNEGHKGAWRSYNEGDNTAGNWKTAVTNGGIPSKEKKVVRWRSSPCLTSAEDLAIDEEFRTAVEERKETLRVCAVRDLLDSMRGNLEERRKALPSLEKMELTHTGFERIKVRAGTEKFHLQMKDIKTFVRAVAGKPEGTERTAEELWEIFLTAPRLEVLWFAKRAGWLLSEASQRVPEPDASVSSERSFRLSYAEDADRDADAPHPEKESEEEDKRTSPSKEDNTSQKKDETPHLQGETSHMQSTPAKNPFATSSIVQRTPAGGGKDPQANLAERKLTEKSGTPAEDTRPQTNLESRDPDSDDLSQLLEVISKMKAYTKKQRNVAMDIKRGIDMSEEIVEKIIHRRKKSARDLNKGTASQRVAAGDFATKTLTPGKRPRESPADEGNRKRNNLFPPLPNITPGAGQKNSRDEMLAQPLNDPEPMIASQEGGKEPDGGEYQFPKRKKKKKKEEKNTGQTDKEAPKKSDQKEKKKKKKKNRKSRHEALLIKPVAGKSYAEMLRTLKGGISAEEIKADIKSVRETRAGGVLVELGKNPAGKAELDGAIRKAMGDKVEVKNLIPTKEIEIMDLDSLTDSKEVEKAVNRELKTQCARRINVTKPNRVGLRAAILKMTDAEANSLLKKSRIKIGLVNCRVRERAVVAKCFRCLGYGHLARQCKGPDRSKCCYKCGQENHRAIDCTSEPKCLLCADLKKTGKDLCHYLGNGSCLAFRNALKAAKEKLR